MSNPYIEPALISSAGILASAVIGLGGVVLTIRSQTRRIDADNKAALAEQTGELKAHLKGEGP